MNSLDKFISEFNKFVGHVGKIMPPEGKGTYNKIYFGMSLMSKNGIHEFFINTTEKYQDKILLEDDSFIDHIKHEFEILKYYASMDPQSQKACLAYMKILYLMAYKVREELKSN